jgi:sortase B
MKRRNRCSKKLLLTIDAVLLIVLITSVVGLTVTLVNYRKNRLLYEQASALAVTTPNADETAVPPAATPAPPDTAALPDETPPITVDFESVREEGRHVRGWLYCPETAINYPVVYYSNNEFYLTHDYTGKHSSAGALFFDTRQTKELSGDNIIIYGHHMKDRSMFGSLLQYQKQDYYDAHPILYLLTLEKNYRIDLFAARFVDSEKENYPVWFTNEQARDQFVQTAVAESDFTPEDAQTRPNVQIVSLVTCAYSQYIPDAKFQVLGWLVEIG